MSLPAKISCRRWHAGEQHCLWHLVASSSRGTILPEDYILHPSDPLPLYLTNHGKQLPHTTKPVATTTILHHITVANITY